MLSRALEKESPVKQEVPESQEKKVIPEEKWSIWTSGTPRQVGQKLRTITNLTEIFRKECTEDWYGRSLTTVGETEQEKSKWKQEERDN